MAAFNPRKSVHITLPERYAPHSSGVRIRLRPDGRYRVAAPSAGFVVRTRARRLRYAVRKAAEWCACIAVALALVVAAVVFRGTDSGARDSAPNSRRAP
jgi:hypothetical protein